MTFLNWLIPLDSGTKEAFPAAGKELPDDLSDPQLDFVERETARAQVQEDERERGVQARLIALLGLSSLVTAVLSGAAAVAAADGPDITPFQLVVALSALGYVAVQAVASMLFTLRGLMPKPYPIAPPWAEHRRGDEPHVWNRLSFQALLRSNLRQSRWSTNRRIEDMVLALRSLKRFAWGTVVLFLVLAFITVDQRFGVAVPVFEFFRRISE